MTMGTGAAPGRPSTNSWPAATFRFFYSVSTTPAGWPSNHSYMSNLFKSLFPEKIVAKPDVPFSMDELKGPVRINRQTLELIDNWIDDKAFAASWFNYGVPDFIKAVINKPIGDSLTYTDLMLRIAEKYLQRVNYLEIGVSVGKNFFQLLRSLPKASLTGFDIEEINPVLERQLQVLDKKEWATPA